MNNVFINAEGISNPAWGSAACSFALKVLEEIKRDNWELSIMFCGDEKIKDLNFQYRNKNEATDILSFNLGETMENCERTVYLPGDIVISLETLGENAKYFNISEDEELRRLIIHGILHLDGMDHINIERNEQMQSEPMLILQEEILKKLKNEYIIAGAAK